MAEKIRAIIKRPDEAGHVAWISNTLENLQRTVEGYIETVTLAEDLVVVCNEEGRLQGLPHNCEIAGVDFVGTIALLGVKGEEFCDCPIELKDFKKVVVPEKKRLPELPRDILDREWRSVEDSLPPNFNLVLAICYGNPAPNIRLEGAYELAEYWTAYGAWVLEKYPEAENITVTHWMPLPDPPEGEGT